MGEVPRNFKRWWYGGGQLCLHTMGSTFAQSGNEGKEEGKEGRQEIAQYHIHLMERGRAGTLLVAQQQQQQ